MTLSVKPTGALVRHCGGAENTGARSKTRAPVLFYGTSLVGLVRKPTRKGMAEHQRPLSMVRAISGSAPTPAGKRAPAPDNQSGSAIAGRLPSHHVS